ncbi:uncharacterized protein LOC131444080 [Solea solea]|uniref:uncharacterized protein LOC131444080 n=1 Tax=Solea solea TaxID=90069 RepID=UPI00272CA4AF|nr:uncharacterized protein LOC131444080 [Solea solea]
MEKTDFEDPDELYDSTSDSGDEYVPDSTTESDDSDFNLTSVIGTKPWPLTELCHDSESESCPPVCDTTTPHLESLRYNSSTSDISVNEEPCSSQDAIDTVVVQACQKRNGNRVYNKKQYCLYCKKAYAKMARHLERAHHNKLDVAKALSLPKGSLERKKQLEYIRNRGNYAHNAAVIESGKGELVPFKRPTKDAQGKDFMHCAYCQALFTRKVLWRHMRRCKLQPASVPVKPGKNRVQSMCTFMQPVPSHIGKQMWGVISAVIPDPITDVVKNDNVIIQVGQHLLNKGGMSAKNQQCVREKMREIGRLIHNARRVTSLKTMEDFIIPKNYLQVIKSVKQCPTREENILDHCYTTVRDAYHAVPRAALGLSDHVMVHLIPAYRQKLKLCKPVVRTSKKWTSEAVEDLQACLDSTDWDVFRTATNSLDEYTEAVTSYISFCEDCCVPSCTRVSYNNDKPWFTAKLRRLWLDKEEAFRSGDKDRFKEAKYKFSKAVKEAKRLYSEKLQHQFSAND